MVNQRGFYHLEPQPVPKPSVSRAAARLKASVAQMLKAQVLTRWLRASRPLRPVGRPSDLRPVGRPSELPAQRQGFF